MPNGLNYTLSVLALVAGAYGMIHAISGIFTDGGKIDGKRIGLLVASAMLVYISIAGLQIFGLKSALFGLMRKNTHFSEKFSVGLVAIAIFGIIGVLKAYAELMERLGQAAQANAASNPGIQSVSPSATAQVVRPMAAAGGALLLAHLGFSLARSAPSLQSGAIFSSNLPVLRSELQSVTKAPLAANPVGTYLINNDAQGPARALIVSPTDTGADRVQLATLNNRSVVVGALAPAAAYRPIFQYDPRIATETYNPAALDGLAAEQGLLAIAQASLPISLRQAALNEASRLSKDVTSRKAE